MTHNSNYGSYEIKSLDPFFGLGWNPIDLIK